VSAAGVQLDSLSVVFLAFPVRTAQVALTRLVAADAGPPTCNRPTAVAPVIPIAVAIRTNLALCMSLPSDRVAPRPPPAQQTGRTGAGFTPNRPTAYQRDRSKAPERYNGCVRDPGVRAVGRDRP